MAREYYNLTLTLERTTENPPVAYFVAIVKRWGSINYKWKHLRKEKAGNEVSFDTSLGSVPPSEYGMHSFAPGFTGFRVECVLQCTH